MNLCSTILFLLLFITSGLCQDADLQPKNVIFGQIKINPSAPSIFLSYERVLLRRESIDLGLYLNLNTIKYLNHRHYSGEVNPFLSIGGIISKSLN